MEHDQGLKMYSSTRELECQEKEPFCRAVTVYNTTALTF